MIATNDWPGWVELIFRCLAAIGGLAGLVGGLAMALAHRTFATKDEVLRNFRDHEEQHEEIGRRLGTGSAEFATIKADIAHLPNNTDIAAMMRRIGAVEGSVRALEATLKGIEEVLKRVERPLNLLVEHHLRRNGD